MHTLAHLHENCAYNVRTRADADTLCHVYMPSRAIDKTPIKQCEIHRRDAHRITNVNKTNALYAEFLPTRRSAYSAVFAVVLCLSVRLSVTRRYCV